MYQLILKDDNGKAILNFNSYEDAYKNKIAFENCQIYNYIKIKKV